MLEKIQQVPTVFGLSALDVCTEDTLLYHIISGLHASVNMHIAANYYDMESNKTYANHTMYYNQLGSFPERISNLHFTYALTVRAVNRIHDQLLKNDYTTGICQDDDAMTIIHISELLTYTVGECGTAFNESLLFTGPNDNLLL